MLGGLFLMLSYFGCDQSQVQRYLTAKSVDEGRHSLLMSAYVKIPLQALVLLTGVLVFVFYLFNQPPMLFRPVRRREDPEERARPASWQALEVRVHPGVRGAPRRPSTTPGGGERGRRWRGARGVPRGRRPGRGDPRAAQPALARDVGEGGYKDFTGDTPTPDVNYVFPTFVTTQAADGARRADHRRDLRRRDVEHRGGAELAGDRRR